MNKVKEQISKEVDLFIDDFELQKVEFKDKEDRYIKFFDRQMKEHEKNVKGESNDAFTLALNLFKTHLMEMENRDITALNKKIIELKRIKEDLFK